MAVADTFDALVNKRPYKGPWSVDQAVAEILAQGGRHFDPAVVAAFLLVQQAVDLRVLATSPLEASPLETPLAHVAAL